MVRAETLSDQVIQTTFRWMVEAKNAIDDIFGEGYAAGHPELVSGFIQAAALDQAGMYLRAIAESLENNKAD